MNKLFKVAMLVAGVQLCGSAWAVNEIRMNAPVTNDLPGTWGLAPPLIGPATVVSNVCDTWAPDPSTIDLDVSFEQSRSCDVTTATPVQQRGQNSKTGRYRNVGEPTTETSMEKRPEKQNAVGVKPPSITFKIVNPVAGRNGIYTISASGKTFNAYVDMTTNGGKWILVDRWVTPAVTLTFNDLVVKGVSMKTYSNDPANFPVIPSGTLNTADSAMYVSGNATWNGLYGPWLQFSTFAPGNVQTTSGFKASGGNGLNHTVYHQSIGWYITGLMDAAFGIWTVSGFSGPCGGQGVVGSTKPCPVMNSMGAYANHGDWTSLKSLYLKGQ